MQTNNKLRETMIEVLEYIETFHKYITPGKGKKLTALFAVADTIRNKARAALAEPVRNCDVGTAEEQTERFCLLCNMRCDGCKCDHRLFKEEDSGPCAIAWAQMPYEEGGAK